MSESPQLLSGDEAIALAALHAGVRLGTGYPGTPSTEILETFDGSAAGRSGRPMRRSRWRSVWARPSAGRGPW